jgi:hypothetical protein
VFSFQEEKREVSGLSGSNGNFLVFRYEPTLVFDFAHPLIYASLDSAAFDGSRGLSSGTIWTVAMIEQKVSQGACGGVAP